MSFFIVRNVYHDTPALADLRPAHRDFLRTLVGSTGLRAAGPLQVSPPGGLLIFEATDADAVASLLVKDPLATHGMIASQSIEEWSPLVGDVF